MATSSQQESPDKELSPEAVEKLQDEAPSAKLVAYVLRQSNPLTTREIEAQTLLPKRTVSYAIRNLKGANLIEVRYGYDDARARVYRWSVNK